MTNTTNNKELLYIEMTRTDNADIGCLCCRCAAKVGTRLSYFAKTGLISRDIKNSQLRHAVATARSGVVIPTALPGSPSCHVSGSCSLAYILVWGLNGCCDITWQLTCRYYQTNKQQQQNMTTCSIL